MRKAELLVAIVPAVFSLCLMWNSAVFPIVGLAAGQENPGRQCTYETWRWNTHTKRAVNRHRVTKTYGALASEEVDPASSCTVCEQDQATIRLDSLPPFRACGQFADEIGRALTEIRDSGFPIRTIVGYRVGRTRGKLDQNGIRTQFSNHSFGTAIDINPGLNGLYANCPVFGKTCRLIRGGKWTPNRPGTITENSVAVGAFRAIGFKWGGMIAGRQKDFMHFSLTGY